MIVLVQDLLKAAVLTPAAVWHDFFEILEASEMLLSPYAGLRGRKLSAGETKEPEGPLSEHHTLSLRLW